MPITTSENDIKERLSLGLVTLIAARAGCEVVSYAVDRTSRDISITPISGPPVNIDAQLKSTVNLIDAGDVFKFDLTKKNYDDLRSTDVANAQILIVVNLHELQERWLRQSRKSLVFNKGVYWASLYNAPATANTTKVRVDIPKDQMLTAAGVVDLFTRRLQRIQGNHGGI